ncbi:MAG: hypothetical protein LC104_16140 [Bacteroidales bacterium]|nr:hypothetical protein [Bacteroidales bacterium]
MNHAVCCPHCAGLARVSTAHLGSVVGCPACGETFLAAQEEYLAPPVIRPQPRRGQTVVVPQSVSPEELHDPHQELLPDPDGPTPILIGLTLLPWLFPLVWLMGPLLFGREPLFTLAAPTALAVGLTGLGLGVSYAAGWSHTTRVKGLLALFLLGCFASGFLYFLKKEWLESVRKSFRRSSAEWQQFDPPGREYRVRMPSPVEHTDTPIPDWPLTAYAFVEPHVAAPDLFLVAHGRPNADTADDAEDWYNAVKQTALARGDLLGERAVALRGAAGVVGREFEISLRDGVTNRIIRAYYHSGTAYYLAAEGPFWRPDSPDVKKFLDSFEIIR